MTTDERMYNEALRAATLYYYDGLTTEQVAKELSCSRPKVSRLLSWARSTGVVEIRINNVRRQLSPLEDEIQGRYGLSQVHVVPAPEVMGEVVWLERVARFTANHLNATLADGQVMAVAWGTTLSEVAANLVPLSIPGLRIVQLNGSGNTFTPDNRYAAAILQLFAANYDASVVLFPVPTFFDYEETKEAMWRERSVQRIIDIQLQADVLLYSIGSVNAGVPSHVYSQGYIDDGDREELAREGIVGDLATIFFRADGTWEDIPLNRRGSGPPLTLYRQVPRAICVVSGRNKIPGLRAALRARLMTELIVDEPTARELCAGDRSDS